MATARGARGRRPSGEGDGLKGLDHSSIPWAAYIFMMCQSIGLPPISTIGFGRTDVSSLRREPKPPAKITAFTPRQISGRPPWRAPSALKHPDEIRRTRRIGVVGFLFADGAELVADGAFELEGVAGGEAAAGACVDDIELDPPAAR